MIRDTATQDEIVDPGPGRRRRRLLLAGGAALLIGTAATMAPALGRWSSAEQTLSRDRMRIATVVRGDLTRDISAQGRVVAAVKPTLFSSADGVVRLEVKAGDSVRRGQRLARIESPELRSELEQETSTLTRAGTALKRQQIEARQTGLENQQTIDLAGVALTAARRELARAEAARAKQAISEFDWAKARDDLATAELRHRHAEQDAQLHGERLAFELQTAQLDIDRQRLRVAELERRVAELAIVSPVSGIVGNLLVEHQDAVADNQPLLTVVDLRALEVELQVPDAYGSTLALGLEARVTWQGRDWPARLVSISPEVVSSQITTRVRFEGELPEALKQNQRVSARILLEGVEDVLSIDRGPFLESSGGRYTYVVDGDLAHRRRISTGLVTVDRVQILGGVEPGDRVVVSSLSDFRDAETVYLD